MVRVVLGGDGMAAYEDKAFTDRYVKLLFPVDDGTRIRTYTVRSFDPTAGELAIDVVQHGSAGIAGPWAANAQPGDRISLRGPGGACAPDLDADWYLFVGDPAAFPAIAVAVAALPADATVIVVVRAHDDAEAAYLPLPEGVDVHWVIGDEQNALVDALASLPFPQGAVDAFVHGELREIRTLRIHLLEDRGVPADRLSISGYWREGLVEEEFQVAKREA
jgi:NADPH-dependent ferric siderophore reductase